MLKALLKIVRNDPLLAAPLSKLPAEVRPSAETAVAQHIARRLGPNRRRALLQLASAGVGLSALALATPFNVAASTFWSSLLESALELLSNFLNKALERVRFARQAAASQVDYQDTPLAQQGAGGATTRGRTGEVLFYDQNGRNAETGSFPMNGSRALTFAPNNLGNGSIASLHRSGRSMADGRLWGIEYPNIDRLEQAVDSRFIAPNRPWTAAAETPALERRIIDSGRDPALWKPTATRGYDRASPNAAPDTFQVVQISNIATRQTSLLV